MQYLHEWQKSPMEIQVLEFMSEIKFDLTLNKKGCNMSKHVIMGGFHRNMVGIRINKVNVFYLLFLSASDMVWMFMYSILNYFKNIL